MADEYELPVDRHPNADRPLSRHEAVMLFAKVSEMFSTLGTGVCAGVEGQKGEFYQHLMRMVELGGELRTLLDTLKHPAVEQATNG